MLPYKEYEKEVFTWLMNKHNQDNNFTFSVRMKGSKRAELDYFIGTENSNYFGMTFWSLPVNFPGSSGDCIDLIFKSNEAGYNYYFEFTQTADPVGIQNVSALNLIKSLKGELDNILGLGYQSKQNNKMYTLRAKPKQYSYNSLDEMLVDIELNLNVILPLVDKYILIEKSHNPDFKADRISKMDFDEILKRMNKRFKKYSKQKELKNYKEEFRLWLNKDSIEGSGKTNSYVRAIELLEAPCGYDVFTINDIKKLSVLHSDLKKNEKNEKDKSYNADAPSYGNKGFYSAGIKKYIDFLSDQNKVSNEMNKSQHQENKSIKPLNQILYGPPGTGKTFALKKEYFSKYSSKETSISKAKHFENVVKECSWWQVIAIALLDLGKSKVSDIFQHAWVQQKVLLSESKTVRPTLWGQLQTHTIETCEFVGVKNRRAPFIFNKTEKSDWEILEDEVKEQVPELYDLLESVNNFVPNPDKEIKRYKFTTFHQSFSYEDFIEGIKPIMPENGEESDDLGYKVEDGLFKQMCKDAENDPDNRYAIFIDEINRGNVSAIFGELITLIEPDKRKGAKNEISVVLPYSKKTFAVPQNLDIIGTMNTADRSVEALDTALRRRFSFVEMMPKSELLKDSVINGIALNTLLKTINERIEVLIDRDHTIGHAYFINVTTEQELKGTFKNNIVPLLQEYFFGDYSKIGLVLGEGFVKAIHPKTNVFANLNNYDGALDYNQTAFELITINDGFNITEAIANLLPNSEDQA